MDDYKEQVLMPALTVPEEEPKIIINTDLRTVTVPKELKDIGVVGDHYAETVYFECPRYFDGIDLSEKNCEIRYINAAGYEGISKAIDVISGENQITFGWEISREVTLQSGTISFAVFFYSTEGRGYQYGTTTTKLNILKGLDDGIVISEQDNTMLLQIRRQLSDIMSRINEIQINIVNLQTNDINTGNDMNLMSGDIQTLKEDILFLKDNVIYTSNISS